MYYPVKEVRILSGARHNTFGWVRKGGTKAHQGWDFEARDNTPLYAVGHGEVVHADRIDDSRLGKQILIQLDGYGEELYAMYAHINTSLVSKYDVVAPGDLIGYSGSTGNAKGSKPWEQHLHFEFRNRRYAPSGLEGRVDPVKYFGPPPYSWMCHPGPINNEYSYADGTYAYA